MAHVCGPVLWPAPDPRLCPSQLDRKRGLAGVVVESRVWHRLRDIQRRYGLYGACDILAAVARQPVAARRDAAIGLRHLPVPLHVHHLDAIFCLRPGMARRRQGGYRVHRYARRQLVAYGAIAQDSAGGTDDLIPTRLPRHGRPCAIAWRMRVLTILLSRWASLCLDFSH